MPVTTAGLADRPNFARDAKTSTAYLDVAANTHGAEKGKLMHRALQRVQRRAPRAVELGPGGGAAVAYLASKLAQTAKPDRQVSLTLIEAPGVRSQSLTDAIDDFKRIGHCELRHGLAQDLNTLLPEPVDVISASALLHEVYSYGTGYAGLHAMIRTLPQVLTPGGFFAYRDVYAVDAPSLYERATQTYHSPTWLTFLRLFTPRYLAESTHPYHRADDEVVARQNSRMVPLGDLDPRTCAVISAPVGLFREIQRHYLTFRDHVWRSGLLGFTPVLDGDQADDWVDLHAGHKRVHFRMGGEVNWLPQPQSMMLAAMSEPYLDHHTIDSDIFDSVTEVALLAFLNAVTGDAACRTAWEAWLLREGRETYAYLTADQLLTAFVVHSTEADRDTVLMPIVAGDVGRVDRHYYNRFLARQLANPLRDAKQLVLFCNVPRNDTDTLRNGLGVLAERCSKPSLARIYTVITTDGGTAS
ncbi:hypothetical protein ACWT_3569 [Actinoplanes sp. SE50]|uniref:hypothetical protein n=1 Tax=unclassified Actinoplanes TaxID=2626549 RepID=UPI00023EC0E2|nr:MULTISPECIES: hypothetical protein [unclassified Actinoplanes]AEV84592.1 hypothetical protein ACPL_3697 [Actinoplanes sp. SE50/110]ATO82984.1 hypothetical protein ACWT_3569 [Actinoplanes sp. SE50]SLM00392.1 hypothetical protein ACSP50_3624 [Actinoplanes sp. SE50/110]